MTLTKLIIAIILTFSFTSCSKEVDPVPPGNNDTIPNPPPPPPPGDTVTLVHKLEEIYQWTSGISNSRTFSFYYDAQKRVITVGIKGYFDSTTVRLFYTGNQNKPHTLINTNSAGSDTTWFTYAGTGQILKDSTSRFAWAPGNIPYRQKLVRHYSIASNNTLHVQMYRNYHNTPSFTLFRSDTVTYHTDTTFNRIKVSYPAPGSTSDAIVGTFTYTSYKNPLARLNIAGMHYMWLANDDEEILGSIYYKTVYNSNILPTYIDFASARIPSQFFNSHYNSVGGFINGDEFDITIVPWAGRANYPLSITVIGSTSFPGDKFIYNYHY